MDTVRSFWKMACPKCGNDEQLDITATVEVRLTPDGTDADESFDGSHEWGEESPCVCRACGFVGPALNFTVDDPDDDDDDAGGESK